jgi:glycosyltransferase involved in cell wall biosynthesis
MKRIGINALCYSPLRAGVSNYIYDLTTQFSKTTRTDEFFVFLPTYARSHFIKSNNLTPIFLPVPNILARFLTEQLVLPVLFYWFHLDLLHSMGNIAPILLGNKNIVTIHDVYFLRDRKRFGVLKQCYLRLFVCLTVKSAHKIIAVSNFTHNEIRHFYGIPENHLITIYEGFHQLSVTNDKSISRTLSKFGICTKYFLFVGTIEPGKNILGLIKAFDKAINQKYSLVIVGKPGWEYSVVNDYLQDHFLDDRVFLTGYVDEFDLANLYHNALSLVLPSFDEGFGLPILEAMSQGCPVCCSNTSCLPEIAGDAALFFDPNDIDDIAHTLVKICDDKIRSELREKGFLNLKRFSWESCAKEIWGVYDELV